MNKPITIVLYDEKQTFQSKKKAIDFLVDCASNADGNEQRRYMNTLVELDLNLPYPSDHDGDKIYDYDDIMTKYAIPEW